MAVSRIEVTTAFQYSAEEWAEMEKDPEKAGMLETELFQSVNNFQAFYERMCKTCTRAVQCREECTECDEFRERLESEGVHKFRICDYYYLQKLREMPRYHNGIEEKQIEPKRPKGEWTGKFKNECPVCGEREDKFIYGWGEWEANGKSNFCPNCGADMRGDKEWKNTQQMK